jgi:hypothetical protein
MGAYLSLREPGELGRVLQSWREAVWVGLLGMVASAGWFTAMTLQNAGLVRALGQVELLFTFAPSLWLFRERVSAREVADALLIVLGLAVLVLQRAGLIRGDVCRGNAINGPLGQALAAAVADADANANDNVRVLLLRGSGGAFCSGLDLKEFNATPAPSWVSGFGTIRRGAHRALFNCSKPIVGALERYAINSGAALAIACDLLVAGEQAYLQVGEVQQGMAAPYNLAWLRLHHSEAVAAQVALVGKRLPARNCPTRRFSAEPRRWRQNLPPIRPAQQRASRQACAHFLRFMRRCRRTPGSTGLWPRPPRRR